MMGSGWQLVQKAGQQQDRVHELIQKVLSEDQSQRPMTGCRMGWQAAGQPEKWVLGLE